MAERKKTILVTGGSGFIGSYVTQELIDRDYHVLVFDHSLHGPVATGLADRHISHYAGDIRDEVAVTEAMAHADGFIHLAGVLGTAETIANPKPAILTNITGGLNILEAAVQYDVPGVNIAVGNWWENNPYSISKNSVERLVKMYRAHRGARVNTVRALNAYGPGQSVAAPYGTSKVRKIVPSFICRALAGDPIEVYGDGLQVMDMIHVRDVAEVLVDTLDDTLDGALFEDTIEAGRGENTTVLEVAVAVQSLVPDSHIDYLPMRPGESASRPVVADLALLGQLYPFGRDFIDLRTGLAETVAYYRDHFFA